MLSLKDRYPCTVASLIARPAARAPIQIGMTFKTKHFGKTQAFVTVQKFTDGAGQPCWYCESKAGAPFMRSEACIAGLLKLGREYREYEGVRA